MLGHRTRLVQEPKALRHRGEDDALVDYHAQGYALDGWAAVLFGVVLFEPVQQFGAGRVGYAAFGEPGQGGEGAQGGAVGGCGFVLPGAREAQACIGKQHLPEVYREVVMQRGIHGAGGDPLQQIVGVVSAE